MREKKNAGERTRRRDEAGRNRKQNKPKTKKIKTKKKT